MCWLAVLGLSSLAWSNCMGPYFVKISLLTVIRPCKHPYGGSRVNVYTYIFIPITVFFFPFCLLLFYVIGPSIKYVRTWGGGGSSLLYISIAYYMQKGGGWVQIACKIAYVLNGRPLYHTLSGRTGYRGDHNDYLKNKNKLSVLLVEFKREIQILHGSRSNHDEMANVHGIQSTIATSDVVGV